MLCSSGGFATLYIAATDPDTRSIGLAYSSSGAHFWQTKVRGKGLIGAQALGLCAEATPEVFLQQGFAATVVAQKLYDQCHAVGWESYRLAVITSDGSIASVIARLGCTSDNQSCGELRARDFLIIGGGLEPETLPAGRDAFNQLDPKVPLPCRLFLTLKAVYSAGGEKKNFRGASITIDDPSLPTLLDWEALGDEPTLLGQIEKQMNLGGITCE